MGSDAGRDRIHAVRRGISIHAPRMGSDALVRVRCSRHREFQSTLPGWGATRAPDRHHLLPDISIHAPRMGSDHPVEHVAGLVEISIHAPRMGSDLPASLPIMPALAFQSTLPGWGATSRPCATSSSSTHFNPRSPDGERQRLRCAAARVVYFNPRSPDGERLMEAPRNSDNYDISIHAPRMGSDLNAFRGCSRHCNFNPRSPDGERPYTVLGWVRLQGFQSTLPGWGATTAYCRGVYYCLYFNPRSPDGERLHARCPDALRI